MTTKKEKTQMPTPMTSTEIPMSFPTGSAVDFAETFLDKLDQTKINSLEDQVKDLKEKTEKKVYAVKFSAALLTTLIDFVENRAEWAQTESLGVIEVHKILSGIKKEGVKDNTIFLGSLPLEATHYFLSKTRGKGLKEAQNFIDLFKPVSIALEEVKRDAEAIQSLEDQVKDLKEKTEKKVYAVKLSSNLLTTLIEFVENHAEWAQTESLGVIEVHKILSGIKKEGVKDNTIFLGSLPLEATHYFLSKTKGKGLKEAQSFIDLFKPISIALEEVKRDAESIQSLEKDLVAAQQGIDIA